MDQTEKIIHYYHANADAFGGRLERPFELTLPVLAPTSLPVVGGYASARHDNFQVGELISIDKAYTQVAGSYNADNGSFTTLVTAVIEGLRISDLFFADRIAVQLSTEHPPDNYFPNVYFEGTEYRGLRVGDAELTPVLKLDLLGRKGKSGYPSESGLYNSRLREFAKEQSAQLADLSQTDEAKKMPIFQRLFERHCDGGPNSDGEIQKRGNVICSVVEEIKTEGIFLGTAVGHVISIPEFGRIYLGELIVDHNSYDLNMIRLDLGCATKGKGSGPHGGANGTNSGGS